MKVNGKKTGVLVISQALSYEARAHIVADSQEVNSTKSLKMLGFIIDSDGGIWGQIRSLRGRFRQRVWSLRLAKKCGMSEKDMISAYKTHVRPIVETNSVIIHSMATAEQSETLERQQTLALRIIYGPGLSARKMRERAGVERLEERRREACMSFVRKNLESDRFGGWFQKRPQKAYGERKNTNYRPYKEEHARTDRRYNSPIFYYRRLANEMHSC
jgi:hypothetical protein